MDRFFKLILIRMIIVIVVFAGVAFYFKESIAIGVLVGGIFSTAQFFYFKKKLKRKVKNKELPKKGILNYFLKLGIAVGIALGISYFNKMLAIGFLIGLPAMQISMMSTAFNKRILEEFMKDNYHEDKYEE